eukprot:3786762-Rhodomonas_salina.1
MPETATRCEIDVNPVQCRQVPSAARYVRPGTTSGSFVSLMAVCTAQQRLNPQVHARVHWQGPALCAVGYCNRLRR